MNLNTITRGIGKVKLFAKDKSPEIFLVLGTVSFGLALYKTCTASFKFEEVLDRHNKRIEELHATQKAVVEGDISKEEYNLKDSATDIAGIYSRTAWDTLKLYGPAIGFAAISLGCFFTSTGIVQRRYLGLATAYTALANEKKFFEGRVLNELGKDKFDELKYGLRTEEIVETHVDEKTGEVVGDVVEKKVEDPLGYSAYARLFDESNRNYTADPRTNRIFLSGKQIWFNHILHTRGYVLLNEVYEALGFELTQAGQIMGWVDSKEGEPSKYISIGINEERDEAVTRFLDGAEASIVLEFNIDPEPILGRTGLAMI